MIGVAMLYVAEGRSNARMLDIRHPMIGALSHGRSRQYFRLLSALWGVESKHMEVTRVRIS